MHPRGRATARRTLLAAAWMVATVLAATIAWSAVARLGQFGADLTAPLSQTDVQRALDRHPPPAVPAQPDPTSSPTRSATGNHGSTVPPPRSVSWTADGGSVGATCRGRGIGLDYATPRDGWSVLPFAPAPHRLTVTFTSGSHVSTLTATCRAGVPSGTIEERSTSTGGPHDDGGTDGGDR